MARLHGVATQFSVARQATHEETRNLLAATAKRLNAEVLMADPKPSGFKRWVDGREGVPEEVVKFGGVVFYRYQRLDLVVQFAMETLFDRSPVMSGDYRLSHTIFLHGLAVHDLKGWKPGDEVIISNPLPYARKIELGKMTMRVPGTDHVYAQAEQIVKRRYGNMASVKFTYQGLAGRGTVGGRAGNKAALRYPALIISER